MSVASMMERGWRPPSIKAGRLGRQILVYGLGYGVAKSAALLAVPVLTRRLGPIDYGLYTAVIGMFWLLMAVAIIGGDVAYTRFVQALEDDDDRRQLAFTWISFLAVASTLISLVLLPLLVVGARWLVGDGHDGLVVLLTLTVPFLVTNTMLAQVLRNSFRVGVFALLTSIEAVLNVGLGLLAVTVLGMGLNGLGAGALAGEAVALPFLLAAVRTQMSPHFSVAQVRRLLSFGLPMVPLSVSYWVFLASDRVLLGRLSGLHELGLYAVAVQVSLVLNMLQAVVSQAWGPWSQSLAQRDGRTAPAMFAVSGTRLLCGFGAVAVALTALAPEAVRIAGGERFSNAAPAVAPLALAGVAYASVQMTSLGLVARSRTHVLALASAIAAIVNVALNVALDPAFGQMGAAMASLVTYAGLSYTYHLASQRALRVPYPPAAGLAIGVIVVTVGLLGGLTGHASLPVRAGVGIAGFLLLAWAWRVSARGYPDRPQSSE